MPPETVPNAVDWTTVLLALISLVGTIATAVLAYLANKNANRAKDQGEVTAKAVDGVVTQLLAAKDETIATAAAAGEAKGKVEVLERAKE